MDDWLCGVFFPSVAEQALITFVASDACAWMTGQVPLSREGRGGGGGRARGKEEGNKRTGGKGIRGDYSANAVHEEGEEKREGLRST